MPSRTSDHHKTWDAPAIKAQLERRGITLNSLSVDNGCSRKMAARALHKPYPRFEKIIATALGVRPQEIWPDRYDALGNSVVKHGRPRSSGRRTKSGRLAR